MGFLDSINSMGGSVRSLYDIAQTKINDPATLKDPQKMLEAKVAEAQYETAVEFEASLITDFKQMMQKAASA